MPSKKIKTISIIFSACLMVWSLVLAPVPVYARTLDEVQQELDAVSAQISSFQDEIRRLSGQAQTLERELARLYMEIQMLEAQIEQSELEIERLEGEIAAAEERIDRNLNSMADGLVTIHLSESVTPIERLVSSQNVSEYVDHETALKMISSQLASSVVEIRADRERLDADRIKVEAVRAEQVLQRNNVDARRDRSAQLLSETRGQEAAFRAMNEDALAQRQALMAEQYRIIQASLSTGSDNSRAPGQKAVRNFSGLQGCRNYPASQAGMWGATYGCNYPTDRGPGGSDGWDEWGLLNRECVSYAAYRLYYGFGKDVKYFQGAGNAKQWPSTASRYMNAIADNYPEVGAAAVWPQGTYGHVMVVEKVLADGWILVSQFNYIMNGRYGEYSTMEIPADSAIFVHFRNR